MTSTIYDTRRASLMVDKGKGGKTEPEDYREIKDGVKGRREEELVDN